MKTRHLSILVILIISGILAVQVDGDHFPCVAVKFGYDSVVCACNASYCDSVPEMPTEYSQSDHATLMTSSQAGARLQLSTARWQSADYTGNSRHDNQLPAAGRVHVNITSTAEERQTILGFGGAFTDAAGINIAKLPPSAQRKLIESYYGPHGIGYSIARVPMAGCDFSTHPYSYADVENDTTLSHFSLAHEDLIYKLPYLKMAQNMSKTRLKVFGSPWSAPGWMKTNGDFIGRGFLKPEHYQTWADYFLRFIEEYDRAGVKMWAITTQNEPIDGLVPRFPFNCMGWTPQEQARWVRDHLAPTISQSERFNHTKIMILDDNRFELPYWLDAFFADRSAAESVDGIAVHWYGDPFYPSWVLDDAHRRQPGKFLLNTEACEGSMPWQLNKVALGSWRRAETYAGDIIKDLQHWVTGWVDWNIALDMNGGPNWVRNFVDSPIIVDSERRQFYKQPMFYAMAHFATLLPPGTVVLRTDAGGGDQDGVSWLVARTPSRHLVVTLLNMRDQPAQVTITNLSKRRLHLTLPARSITSVRWLSGNN